MKTEEGLYIFCVRARFAGLFAKSSSSFCVIFFVRLFYFKCV